MLYREIFAKRHILLVAVHVDTPKQTQDNVQIAKEEGADGVFLVNHAVEWKHMTEWYHEVRQKHPDFWVGLNYLDLRQLDAMRTLPCDASGLWVDDMGIRDDDEATPNTMRLLRANWWLRHPERLHFGGVAHKGQRPVADPAQAAKNAVGKTDVITTSGEKTGSAPTIEKIVSIRRAIGDEYPLAVASGISRENVRQFKPYVDCFIVASSIGKSFYDLDPSKVRSLAKIIHE